MQRSNGLWTTGALVALTLVFGLALTVGGPGGALAQDDPTPVPDRAIEVMEPELVAQVEVGAPVSSVITVDGQPFVFAEDGSFSRVGPGGLEPLGFIGLEQDGLVSGWVAYETWPVRGGGTTFLAKFEGLEGESTANPLPGVLLPDGSMHLLIGGSGHDLLIAKFGPGGTSTLSLSGLTAIVPTLQLNQEGVLGLVEPIVSRGGGNTVLVKFDGIDGEATYTGWFDHSGNFNMVGVIEYQDGNDLILLKGDPVTGVWTDMRPLNLVINLSVGWEPRGGNYQVVPHGDGGLSIIAVELDAGYQTFTYDAVGNLVAQQALAVDRPHFTSLDSLSVIPTGGAPLVIMPDPRTDGGWQIVDLDPAAGGAAVYVQEIPSGFSPRPDLFLARGDNGMMYLAIQDGTSNTFFMAHVDTRTGGGGIFNTGSMVLGFDVPLAAVVSPDGSLFVTIDHNHQVVRLDPSGASSILLGGDGPDHFQEVSGLSLDADGLLYVGDRSGTVSVFSY